jgi:hypothetical protein
MRGVVDGALECCNPKTNKGWNKKEWQNDAASSLANQ